MQSISGYKDTDREILLFLNDKDLLAACSTNKYFFSNVCNDEFFHKKLLRSYPDTLKYFENSLSSGVKTYKQYYLKIIYYISKLKEEFNYFYNLGNPMRQYDIFYTVAYDRFKNNQELLFQAATKGDVELVKEAIKRGADIHKNAELALRLASENGHLEVIKYLVNLKANIHVSNELSLKVASINGHLDTVKYLISLGADIHSNNEEALRWAAKLGHFEVVNYLSNL